MVVTQRLASYMDGFPSSVAPDARRTPCAGIMLYRPRVKVVFGDWEAEDFGTDLTFLV